MEMTAGRRDGGRRGSRSVFGHQDCHIYCRIEQSVCGRGDGKYEMAG